MSLATGRGSAALHYSKQLVPLPVFILWDISSLISADWITPITLNYVTVCEGQPRGIGTANRLLSGVERKFSRESKCCFCGGPSQTETPTRMRSTALCIQPITIEKMATPSPTIDWRFSSIAATSVDFSFQDSTVLNSHQVDICNAALQFQMRGVSDSGDCFRCALHRQ